MDIVGWKGGLACARAESLDWAEDEGFVMCKRKRGRERVTEDRFIAHCRTPGATGIQGCANLQCLFATEVRLGLRAPARLSDMSQLTRVYQQVISCSGRALCS